MAMVQRSPDASATPSTRRQTAQSPALATSFRTAVANAPNGVRTEVSIEQASAYAHRLIGGFGTLQLLPDSKPLAVDPDDL